MAKFCFTDVKNNVLKNNEKDLIEYFDDDVFEDDYDSEAEIFGYDEDDEDVEDVEDVEGGEYERDDVNDGIRAVGRAGALNQIEEESDAGPEHFPDFDLDPEESLLPLIYVVSPFEQWSYAMDACLSDFRHVKNLDKVNNKTLKLIADAASLANSNGTSRNLQVNNAFIKYARQRNV